MTERRQAILDEDMADQQQARRDDTKDRQYKPRWCNFVYTLCPVKSRTLFSGFPTLEPAPTLEELEPAPTLEELEPAPTLEELDRYIDIARRCYTK